MTALGTNPKRPKVVRRSNRDTVQWVPVTEASFARAVLAAEIAEVDLAVWLDEAIKIHLDKTRAALQDRLYQEACDRAAERMDMTPTRWEFDREERRSYTRPPAAANEQRGPTRRSAPTPHS